ncbi:OmpA domain protein [Oceanicola granulosus HTCC2516]|uniref:OmpA domain protein n=1 Tax=Oceanicola granulosus (strain ATCC BAA-861 / DSM 15982 / KCTC 12143 / HTCC2516) TaxID=314256 RepID=Q2CD42_OCEGH|nr:OmpA family protein [Oceanicola granulosus]EAR50636.1 OmpA domain protein [Oceanicola granulosus HTCC2516]
MIRGPLLALLLAPAAAAALTLDVPGETTRTLSRPLDTSPIATGPFDGASVPLRRPEGAVTLRAWRVEAAGLTTLQLLAPLRDQLEAAGYEVLFTCAARECGGFDFRFALEVLPAPDMHVGLGDYRYLSAQKGAEHLALLVSTTSRAGFVQLTRIAPEGAAAVSIDAAEAPAVTGGLGAELEARGHVVLGDLDFETGSARLGPGSFASLDALARYLAAAPARRVVLVGHTDSQGSLAGNISLSRRRADQVRTRLIAEHGTDPAQLTADGVGYLAPVASNLTPEGREANRRVEAVLVSTE